MRPISSPRTIHQGKLRLLGSCAVAAGLMALAMAGPAHAQGVAGSGNVTLGNATISPGAPANTTDVVTSTGQTIINWTPTDNAATGGAIDFLPAGNTLNFYGASGQYTVLNRFVSNTGLSIGRVVALNGTVNSFVGAPANPNSFQGGNIWFYNAGGILIGGGAAINVGSLLLTANDIDTSGGLFSNANNIRFRGVSGSTSAVTISQGASITASNGNPGGSYIAMVAPRIVQNGIVSTDGSTAYVAAEQADIRINNGLFDINVTVGAEGGNAITHTGTTTGPAHQQGDINDNRIYMVAIPKNDAVTMLVSGQVGYQDAASAQIDPDGAVILSAGYNVNNGEIDSVPFSSTASDIRVNDTAFLSNTMAHASGQIIGSPQSPSGEISVEGNATFIGDTGTAFTIGAGQQITSTGDFTVQANGTKGAPGTASMTLNGGLLDITGDLYVVANGPVLADGSNRGGNASLVINAGTARTSDIFVAANALGGIGAGGDGGVANGGTAAIMVDGTGALFANNVNVLASATGGGLFVGQSGLVQAVDNGGDAVGGAATISVTNGGRLSTIETVSVDASGFGQTGNIQSGSGSGGSATVQITGAGSDFSAAQTQILASGFGGGNQIIAPGNALTSFNGGDGVGGTADLLLNGDTSTNATLGGVIISASAAGGDAVGEGARGGDAYGGAANLSATGGIDINPDFLSMSADAESGGGSSPSGIGLTTGDAFGGSVTITAGSGSVIGSDGDIDLDVRGEVASNENRGSSTGGTIFVRATTGATISALNGFIATASAGRSFSSTAESIGSSTGGTVDLIADGGSLSGGYFSVDSSANTTNSDSSSGDAQGGSVTLVATNDGVIESVDQFNFNSFSSDATTGSSTGGANATGGTVTLTADGGQIDVIGFANMSAEGTAGGDSNGSIATVTAGTGGTILVQILNNASGVSAIGFENASASSSGFTGEYGEGGPIANGTGAASGIGGNVVFDVQGGNLTASSLALSAGGFGGDAGNNGGTGFGGSATFTQSAGTVNVGDLTVSADGSGGSATNGGTSGDGVGGIATINFNGGTFAGQNITAFADGFGGNGISGDDSPFFPGIVSNAGNGTGGNATINLDGTASVTTQTMLSSAVGTGGEGGGYRSFNNTSGDTGTGGNGTGGNATVNLIQGNLIVQDLSSDASGIGGNGGDFSNSSSGSGTPTGVGVGGDGGTATGGTATINFETAVSPTGFVTTTAIGRGGNGGFNDIGGSGGSSIGGLAQVLVNDLALASNYINLDARGLGGAGSDGQNGSGGNGGSGTGGTTRVQLEGANADVNVDQSNFVNAGIGGNGGNASLFFGNNPAVGPNGGNGGDGNGGTTEIFANGGNISIGTDDDGVARLGNGGVGGAGGNGATNVSQQPGGNELGGDGGDGGNGIGGTVHLLASGGTISLPDSPIEFMVSGTAGDGGVGGFGTGGSGASGFSGFTGGGVVTLEAEDSEAGSGQIDFADTSIDASGDFAGRINLINRSSGAGIRLDSLNASAFGSTTTSVPPSSEDSGIYIAGSDGQILIGNGGASLQSDGTISFDMQNDAQFVVNGSLDVFSSSLISASHINSFSFNPSVSVNGDVNFDSSGDILTDSEAQFSASGDIFFNASGNIDIGIVDAGNNATLIASGSTNASAAIAGGDLYAEGGSVGIGFAGSGGSTMLVGTGSDVSFGTIESGTSTNIDAFGGVFGGDITAGNDLTITAGADGQINSLFAGDDISLNFAGALSIGSMYTDASGGDNEEDGSNVVISAGATTIDHSETADNFTADVASFRTGLNSLITGGDININSPGAVDLGNSTAGGFIQVLGQSIDFVALDAGSTVSLNANGTTPGAEGISGVDIVSGGDVSLFGNSIAVSNSLQSGGGLFANATGGPATINGADTVGDISVFAEGNLSGSFTSGGNVNLQSNANVNASAIANGGFVNGNGGLSEGTVFVIAAGNATLTNSAAATMFGVSAGQAASLTNASAGEDMLVLAGTTAALSSITAGDDVIVQADGTITAQGVSATGAGSDTRELLFNAGGSTGFPSMFVTNATAADGADITLTSFNGAIGAATLTAGDDIILSAATTLALDGATTLGIGSTDTGSSITTQSGDASFANLDAFDDIEIDSTGAASITGAVAAGRDMTVAADSVDMALLTTSLGVILDTLTIGRDLSITASNAITGGHSLAGGEFVFDAGTNIDILSASTSGGGLLSLNGTTGVFANTVSGSGETDLFSDAGAVQVNSLASDGLVYAVGDSIAIDGSNSLVFEQLDTDVGNAVVDTSGNLTVNASTIAGQADLSAGNNLNIVQLDANDVILAAGNDMTLSTVTASNVLQAEADQTINIMNGVTGRAMSILSADIVIATDARLGTVNSTESLDIRNNNSDNQTFIGGTGSRNGYHLDAAEMTRIFGSDITVFAPEVLSSGFQSVGSSAPPDVIIDDFVLTAGGSTPNLGPNGGFTILTPGKARVIGNASLTGLSDNNSFNLFADDAIEVIMGQGMIRLTGSGSNPAGMLFLQSDDVIVATLAAINDVGAASGTDAINARLAQNEGFTSNDGALYAGGIDVNVAGGLYVQNSGTGTDFAQRRGLTFGALGFSVTTASSTTRIVVNGQQLGPNGTINGLDTIALLNISSGSSQTGSTTASFDPRSTFNGCLIANVASCSAPVFPEIFEEFPVQDVIDKDKDDDNDDAGEGSGGIPLPLIELREIDPLPGQPLLDDPVTGAGNDDLWSTPAE